MESKANKFLSISFIHFLICGAAGWTKLLREEMTNYLATVA